MLKDQQTLGLLLSFSILAVGATLGVPLWLMVALASRHWRGQQDNDFLLNMAILHLVAAFMLIGAIVAGAIFIILGHPQ